MTTEPNALPAAPAEGTPPAAPADATPPAEATPPAAVPAEGTPTAASTAATPPAEPTEFQPYELTAPEGIQVNADELKEFTAFANELKIPKEKAEAFSAQFAQKQLQAVQTQIAAWREEAMADKELGGPKFEENVGIAKKALKKFGGDEVLNVLEKTGLGNHKAIIRAFLQVGKAMSDDNVPGANAGAPSEPKTFATALFAAANSNKKES